MSDVFSEKFSKRHNLRTKQINLKVHVENCYILKKVPNLFEKRSKVLKSCYDFMSKASVFCV